MLTLEHIGVAWSKAIKLIDKQKHDEVVCVMNKVASVVKRAELLLPKDR